MLPKDMTHAVPISGGAASFYSGARASACAARSASRRAATDTAPQGDARSLENYRGPQQKGPAAARRAGPRDCKESRVAATQPSEVKSVVPLTSEERRGGKKGYSTCRARWP